MKARTMAMMLWVGVVWSALHNPDANPSNAAQKGQGKAQSSGAAHLASRERKNRTKPHLQQIRKHNHILKRLCNPHKIKRILLHTDPLRQSRRIITTQPAAIGAIRIDTNTKVSDADLELGVADDVGDRGGDVGVHLGGGVGRRVGLVVEGDQEDVGDAGGGGGAAG